MTDIQDNFDKHVHECLDLLIGHGYKGKEAQNKAVAELQAIESGRLFLLLTPMLNSETLLTRLQASRALLSVDQRKAVELILPFLNDPDPEFRYDVCGLMHDFGDERVINPLIERMQNDADLQIRGIAAYALGGIGDLRAIPALENTINNDHEVDRLGYSPSFSAKNAIDKIYKKTQND